MPVMVEAARSSRAWRRPRRRAPVVGGRRAQISGRSWCTRKPQEAAEVSCARIPARLGHAWSWLASRRAVARALRPWRGCCQWASWSASLGCADFKGTGAVICAAAASIESAKKCALLRRYRCCNKPRPHEIFSGAPHPRTVNHAETADSGCCEHERGLV